jgi:hypothetical protein
MSKFPLVLQNGKFHPERWAFGYENFPFFELSLPPPGPQKHNSNLEKRNPFDLERFVDLLSNPSIA